MRKTAGAVLAAVVLIVGIAPTSVLAANSRSTVAFTIRDAHGNPSGNARVLLSVAPTGTSSDEVATPSSTASLTAPVWSAQADQHATRIGVRRATADAHGRVTLAFEPTPDERAMAAANGDWLNVEAMLLDDNGLPAGYSSYSLYLGSEPSQIAEAHALARASMDLKADANTSNASHVAAKMSTESATSSLDQCQNYRWVSQYDPNTAWGWTTVGELHAATDITSHYFAYGSHADSNIDWGIQYSNGAVSIGGAVHIGNAMDSIDYKYKSGSNQHWQVQAAFNFGNWALYADCQSNGWNTTYMGQWKRAATSHDDHYGLVQNYIITQPARNASYTKAIGRDAGWTRYNYSLAKISGAIRLGVFTFGAQSGASTYVQIHYQSGSAEAWHYIYGNNALPTTSTKVYETNK